MAGSRFDGYRGGEAAGSEVFHKFFRYEMCVKINNHLPPPPMDSIYLRVVLYFRNS